MLLKNSGPSVQSRICHVYGSESGTGLASLWIICKVEALVPWYMGSGTGMVNLNTPGSSMTAPVTQNLVYSPISHLTVTAPVIGLPAASSIRPSTVKLLQPLELDCMLPST